MYKFRGKALVKTRKFVNRYISRFGSFMVHRISRDEAHKERQSIIKKKGFSFVDAKLKNRIKDYCKERFGSSSYWPWIAAYTEIRGEFIEGWIPDDYYRFKILDALNPEKLMHFSEVKSFDHRVFKEFMLEPLFVRIKNQFFSHDGKQLSYQAITKILDSFNDEIVIKSDTGRGGKEVTFVHAKDVDLNQLLSKENLVFQPSVKQHSTLNKINPYSVNTFRVFTHFSREGEIELMLVKLRFGIGKNRVDNTSSGGGYIPILANGTFYDKAFDKNNMIIGDQHPSTGTKFSETKLPFYNDIINLCKEAHLKFPYVGIIGWDVCVQEDGSPLLLEWNANNPGFWNYEAIFGPIWPNKDLSNL